MTVSLVKPPVVIRDVDALVVTELIEALAEQDSKVFASTGESYPSEVKTRKAKDGTKHEYNTGRESATKMAGKLVRAMDSRGDQEYRSRTWQNEDGSWTFGIAKKKTGNGEATEPGEGDAS